MLSKEQTWTGSNSHFALLDQSSAIWTKLAEPLSYFLLVKFHFLLNTEIATLHCCCIHASPKDIGSLQYWTGLPLVHNLGANSMAAFSFFFIHSPWKFLCVIHLLFFLYEGYESRFIGFGVQGSHSFNRNMSHGTAPGKKWMQESSLEQNWEFWVDFGFSRRVPEECL